MSSAALDHASYGRPAYVPITTRHRIVSVALVMVLYVIVVLIAVFWPYRAPLRQVEPDPLLKAFVPLTPPPPPVPPPPPPPITVQPPTPVENAAPAVEIAATKPSAPSAQAGAPAPQSVAPPAPPAIQHFDFTPAPAAAPAPPPPGGSAAKVDHGGAGAGGSGIGGSGTQGSGTGRSGTRGSGTGGSGTGGTGSGGGGAAVAIKAEWAREVSWEEVHAFHPARALLQKVSGSVDLRCQVTLKRKLKSCSVISETPKGWSFGTAALALTPTLRAQPRKIDGAEIDSGWVIFKITFDLPSKR